MVLLADRLENVGFEALIMKLLTIRAGPSLPTGRRSSFRALPDSASPARRSDDACTPAHAALQDWRPSLRRLPWLPEPECPGASGSAALRDSGGFDTVIVQ